MKTAFIGLGKLGLPVSCAMVEKKHTVYGYDSDPVKMAMYREGHCEFYEPDIDEILLWSLANGLHICSTVKEAVTEAEIIFVAVPTPSRDDNAFDSSYVKTACREIANAIAGCMDYKVISIISTVLPGTVRNEVLPVLVEVLGEPGDMSGWGLAYNAQFIAMGTTIQDMLDPEFVLIGEYDQRSGDVLGAFYSQLVDAPLLRMSIENAEMVKVCYNTMIGFKIVYANTIMELCDKIPHANCDVVSDALSLATKRLLSPRYLRGGMGDSGGCHPRDNRALSWLAWQLNLSVDPFHFVMAARDEQSRYLASVVQYWHTLRNLPVAILGLTFKPETNLTTESCSFLLIEHLGELGIRAELHDPIVGPWDLKGGPYVYFVATKHEQYKTFDFVPGSVIIDPWRFITNAPGCDIVRIGICGIEKRRVR